MSSAISANVNSKPAKLVKMDIATIGSFLCQPGPRCPPVSGPPFSVGRSIANRNSRYNNHNFEGVADACCQNGKS